MNNTEKKDLIKIDCGRCGEFFKISNNSIVSLICPKCGSTTIRFSDNVEIGCRACKKNYSAIKDGTLNAVHTPRCPERIFLVRKLKGETV